MPGHRLYLQEGGQVRDELTCSYCKLVLNDPVQTSESGLRFCRECFSKAQSDPNYNTELDCDDEVWPDFAVKREIANLKVKCENYQAGCDWAGLFKELMRHLNDCQFMTIVCKNPGCGERVLLSELEVHLKKKCLHRQVECKDCGKKMLFIELQEHTELCPNAPKVCGNCGERMPASQLRYHINRECKNIRCVCKEDGDIYQVDSSKFRRHLKDTSKLAEHLAPMITEFSKMSLVFQEMTTAYQQLVNRTEELEKRNALLEKIAQENNSRLCFCESTLEKRINIVEEKNCFLENQVEMVTKRTDNQKEDLYEGLKVLSSFSADSSLINSFAEQLEEISKKFTQFETNFAHLKREEESAQSSEPIDYCSSDNGGSALHHVPPDVQVVNSTSRNYQIIELQNRVGELQYSVAKIEQQQTVAIKQKSAYAGEVVPYEKLASSELVKQVEDKVLEVERTLNVLSVHHSELELQLQASLASTHNGALLWRIPEVRRRIRDAKIGRITSIYSPPFYTGRNGYKMCIRAYLNGDGIGEMTHLSIFFVLMRGEFDSLLQWPFKPKVTLILVDQDHKKHLAQTFKPDPQSSSFKKPDSDMNVASGCPEFAELSILDNPSYVRDDVMYIKAIADTTKVIHP